MCQMSMKLPAMFDPNPPDTFDKIVTHVDPHPTRGRHKKVTVSVMNKSMSAADDTSPIKGKNDLIAQYPEVLTYRQISRQGHTCRAANMTFLETVTL